MGQSAVDPPLSLVAKTMNDMRAETVCLKYTAAKTMNDKLNRSYKRKLTHSGYYPNIVRLVSDHTTHN